MLFMHNRKIIKIRFKNFKCHKFYDCQYQSSLTKEAKVEPERSAFYSA